MNSQKLSVSIRTLSLDEVENVNGMGWCTAAFMLGGGVAGGMLGGFISGGLAAAGGAAFGIQIGQDLGGIFC